MASNDYRERLTVPVTWWLLGALFVVAVWWAFFVATPLVVSVIAAVATLGLVGWGLARYGSVLVTTGPAGLRVGRATLPWASIGAAEPLNHAATRRILGVEADARAFLVVRAYCPGSVKVVVDDTLDPTPYWLVSSRHPVVLARYLGQRAVRD
jgi:hypothetical protein